MKPTPLLDLWQKPDGAGDPVGVLATTFALDPDFFERNCLARFLAVESVDEGTKSAEDLVARLELEESLRAPMVTVLADRSAQGERSTLRWDLLHCQVSGGLLHSKVSILLWENATRVIVGSANLTPAGYRHSIELAMAADLGPFCLFPKEVLAAIADELESYLSLVPGLGAGVPANRQAGRILQLFRDRIAEQPTIRTKLAVAIAPTNTLTRPLDSFVEVWSGPQPLVAIQVSPYWDSNDPTVIKVVQKLLTGRPTSDRWHCVAVTVGPGGETSFPPGYLKPKKLVDEVVQLGPLDKNVRPLHAKCLLIHSNQWVAVLIGSSNHTTAGLGLGGARRHRELNLWLGAPLDSKEGKALRALIPCGAQIDVEAPYQEPEDEDAAENLPVLPPFFQLCRLSKVGESWQLRLSFDASCPPDEWRVSLPSKHAVIDAESWRVQTLPSFVHRIDPDCLPMYLEVMWGESKATWVVVADDRHDLPPGLGIADLQSSQLFDALATGKSLAQVLREKLERDALELSAGAKAGIVTDPLKRFDSHSTLLRRGRALATALASLERRLAQPVTTLDALEARLSGPLGPQFIASKVVAEYNEGGQPRPDSIFTLAEIVLAVARVPWQQTLQHVDHGAGLKRVGETLDKLDSLRAQLGSEPPDLAGYATRAIKEAKRCLVS